MSKPIQSFFDDMDPRYTLWKKVEKQFEIDPEDIIFQAPLLRYCTRTNAVIERYFVMTKEFLYIIKGETEPEILGVMSMEWVRVDYLYNQTLEDNNPYFCIRFIRNMRYTDLYTNDEDHFLIWRKYLCKTFMQCDFHTKFNTIKMIGKGSFARVYLVENKETRERYAVKAFSKEYLLS